MQTRPAIIDPLNAPFKYYIWQNRRQFGLGIFFLLATNVLDCLVPLVMKRAVDEVVAGASLPTLARTTILFVAIVLVVAGLRYLWRTYMGRFQHTVAQNLRDQIFTHLTPQGPTFYQKNPVGQLMSLISNDVNSFRMAIGPGLLVLFDAAFLIFIVVPLMISLSPSWTWQTLIFLPLLPFFIHKVEDKLNRCYRRQQDCFSEVSGAVQELVGGIRVIKSYNQEEQQLKLFDQLSKRYELACNESAKTDSYFHPLLELGVATGSVILLYLGSSAVTSGAVTLGTIVAFHRYIQKMIWPMTAIGYGISLLEQGKASFARIREFLEIPTTIPNEGTQKIDQLQSIEIRNLNFSYPDQTVPALKNISFDIRIGETLGIIGLVGSGKSTFTQLLCRLYPVEAGSILINGISIEEIELSCLRSLISLVPQESFLFSETIHDNIALGLREPPPIEQIKASAQLVDLHEEIEDFPDQYQSELGERGVNLSGGQKQRMTLARALIRKSPLVILDDSLSAVDAETEKRLISQLEKTVNQRTQRAQTTLIVTHRLASLRLAHRIVVFNQGEVEAIGLESELLEKSPTYKKIHQLQKSEPEISKHLESSPTGGNGLAPKEITLGP